MSLLYNVLRIVVIGAWLYYHFSFYMITNKELKDQTGFMFAGITVKALFSFAWLDVKSRHLSISLPAIMSVP